MKFSVAISVVFAAFAARGVNGGVTLVQPIPTSIPGASGSSVSIPTGLSGFSIPTESTPATTESAPATTSRSVSSLSVTAFATVSVGGVESADGATTYFVENAVGLNGNTSTFTRTIVQGASVWREDDLNESCALNGKGGAVCVFGPSGFQTTFTGTAFPFTTLGAVATGGSGGGGAGSGGGSAGANPTTTGGTQSGGAVRVNGGASVGLILVGTVAAMVGGMRLVL
ncbi:hypothetical protein MSAN_00283200 [Mycena sanguinolenta]|uniref:Uncharacterized protein n=1 Tax=Mycena sanguinolenta TaxID=230812 RepID=A0A8H6ZAK4_9AGAR|nr:hypothetical protein MSAN_00283200 [Mycena sanguinolenta]